MFVERAGCECRGSSQSDVPVCALNQFGLSDLSYSFSVRSVGCRLLRPLNQSLTQQQVPTQCFHFILAYPATACGSFRSSFRSAVWLGRGREISHHTATERSYHLLEAHLSRTAVRDREIAWHGTIPAVQCQRPRSPHGPLQSHSGANSRHARAAQNPSVARGIAPETC